jgi:hypothetical protein
MATRLTLTPRPGCKANATAHEIAREEGRVQICSEKIAKGLRRLADDPAVQLLTIMSMTCLVTTSM